MLWSIALKVLYTTVLADLVGVLSRELYLLWFDDRVFIGQFDVISDGDVEASASADFARSIVSAQAVLAHQLSEYQRVGELSSVTDTTFDLPDSERVSLPDEVLQGMDITVQSINLTQIFTALRKGFSAPNEVYGHVTSTSGAVLAAVEWPRAPEPAVRGGGPADPVLCAGAADASRIGQVHRLLAVLGARCGQGGETCPHPARSVLRFRHGARRPLRPEREGVGGWPVRRGGPRVRRRIHALSGHDGTAALMPDIYRLRADLMDLLPETSRTASDLVAAQEDRLSYAMFNPKIAELPQEDKRTHRLCARASRNSGSRGQASSSAGQLEGHSVRYSDTVERAVQSTALLRVKKTTSSGQDEFEAVGSALHGCAEPCPHVQPRHRLCDAAAGFAQRESCL